VHIELYQKQVRLPSTKDFVGRYPHYSVVETAGRKLFDTIVTAESFVRAAALTDSLGLPAVSAVADVVSNTCGVKGNLQGFQKQVAGAIMCVLMEENGYKKTGQKRSVSRQGWSRGELYRRI
jgi:hypothetical protein